MARILLDSDSAPNPQHIPGDKNVIADSLSRDFHLSTSHLQLLLKSLFKSQVPKNFKILHQLPTEIISWLDSLQDLKTSAKESLPVPTRSKMGALLDGSDSLKQLVSKINSWTAMVNQQESPSCPRLRLLYDEMSRAKHEKHFSQADQSVRPSTMFVRYFEQTLAGRQL